MIKLLLCSLFAFGYMEANSQKLYFIYLQSEQEQPFFVKLDEKIHSSSASGFLILSRLHDSTYNFSIGFPAQKWTEQRFSVTIASKDHGFILKNFGEKGWGLFDIQTMAVKMALPSGNKDGTIRTEKKEVSAFTDILARAADDPSLREKTITVAKKEEPKAVEPQQAVVKVDVPKQTVPEPPASKPTITETPKDVVIDKQAEQVEKSTVKNDPVTTQPKSNAIPVPANTAKVEDKVADTKEPVIDSEKSTAIAVNDSQPSKPVVKTETFEKQSAPVQSSPEEKEASTTRAPTDLYKRSQVTKNKELSTDEGVSIVFIDDAGNGSPDTINIIIPNSKSVIVAAKETPADQKKFLDINTDVPKENTNADVHKDAATTVAKETASKPPVKNNCKAIATDNDFLKLRKKMVSETDDDDMVDEARKYFKTMCFTTAQVKNLGVLFLDDLGKYKFFDMAYVFVSDLDNFPSLQSELKNEYYINRFRAILGGK